MSWTPFHFRILVLGDIVVDHDILVRESARPHTNLEGETVYQVDQSYTTAGGAAIGARFLAMVNEGDTYLAGYSAPTVWGPALEDVMVKCRIYDNCPRRVKLICVWTAEGRGEVVNRLIELKGGAPHKRPSRWDDLGELTLPSYKRQALPDWIRRVHEETPFDGIIINDLDRGALDKELVMQLNRLAKDDQIPMVVDPKWSGEKYHEVEALVLIPNLKEWCNLVGELPRESHYKRELHSDDCLREMAEISITTFPRVRYHMITCAEEGVLLIGPVEEGMQVPIHRVPAVDIGMRYKLGPGEVLAAQFLASFLRLIRTPGAAEPEAVHEACRWGVAAAAAHLDASWQRVPTIEEVGKYIDRVGKAEYVTKAQWPVQLVWKTVGNLVDLQKMTTPLAGIFTCYDDYNNTIHDIVDHVDKNLGRRDALSLIIGGDSGNGKSAILKGLKTKFAGVDYQGFHDKRKPAGLTEDFAGFVEGSKGRLVLVDEADEDQKYIKKTINEIDKARKSGVVFVFAGCEYNRESLDGPQYRELYIELFTRSEYFRPKSLTNRPCDVPVILAAQISSLLQKDGRAPSRLEVEQPTFDYAVSQVASGAWGARGLAHYAREIVGHLRQGASKSRTPRLAHPSHRNRSATLVEIITHAPGSS